MVEGNAYDIALSPKGEPRLGRRRLYRGTNSDQDAPERTLAPLWAVTTLTLARLCTISQNAPNCRLG